MGVWEMVTAAGLGGFAIAIFRDLYIGAQHWVPMLPERRHFGKLESAGAY